MRGLTERLFSLGQPAPHLAGDGLILRQPQASDFEAWVALRSQSRAFLVPWEPLWPEDDLTRKSFLRRLRHIRQEARDETGYSFLIFRAEDQVLLGGITLSNIRRRAAQSGTLGYWMGESHAGKGHMSRAVVLIARHAFGPLKLERLEAACLAENAASSRVLEKAGFRREGFARGYLAIAGQRRDHVLYGLLRSDFFPPDSGRL